MNSLSKGTWTKWNPLLSGQLLVPKVFCKRGYKTAFNEGKLFKEKTEIKDNGLTESILYVFRTLPSARVNLTIVYRVSAVKCDIWKCSLTKRAAGEGFGMKDAKAYEWNRKITGTV